MKPGIEIQIQNKEILFQFDDSLIQSLEEGEKNLVEEEIISYIQNVEKTLFRDRIKSIGNLCFYFFFVNKKIIKFKEERQLAEDYEVINKSSSPQLAKIVYSYEIYKTYF